MVALITYCDLKVFHTEKENEDSLNYISKVHRCICSLVHRLATDAANVHNTTLYVLLIVNSTYSIM